LEAAAKLTVEPGYRFIFVGDGPEKAKLSTIAKQQKYADIIFMDPLTKDEIPDLLAGADVLLIPLACEIPGAVPSKLYEAMASGRPLVLVASGEPAEIVRKHQAGIVVAPGDVSGLAEAIHALRTDPAQAARFAENARRAAVENYDRAQIAESFMAYLEKHDTTDINAKYDAGYQTDWSAGK
jgi:hypothetical protein